MLVDSHCHLDFPDFETDRAELLERARAGGVGLFQTICTKVTEFPRIRDIAETFPDVYCSVGIHPHHAGTEPAIVAGDLISLAKHPRVIGIGETGLDYFYERSPRDDQERSFRAHIAAARHTGLPIIIHTRDADNDTIRILEDEMDRGPFPGLIHCFTSGREVAETAIRLGLSISISGIVTFKNAAALREIIEGLPPERILVETDAPFLAPVPKRGKRNEPAFVKHTAAFVAELLDIEPERFFEQTTENFFALFSKAERPVDA